MYTQCSLEECLGAFLFSHQGYFNGYILKGVMSDENECACTCRENKDCIAFSFRNDNQKCYVYEDRSNLDDKVDDTNSNAYITTNGGNNYSWLLSCRTLVKHKKCSDWLIYADFLFAVEMPTETTTASGARISNINNQVGFWDNLNYIWYKCNWLKSILFLCFRINIYQKFLQMWRLKKSKLLMSHVLSSLPFILLTGFMMHDLYHNWLITKFFYFDRIYF